MAKCGKGYHWNPTTKKCVKDYKKGDPRKKYIKEPFAPKKKPKGTRKKK